MSLRPKELKSSFIAEATSKASKTHGFCQLLQFHVKKPNIFSCVLSDGNYTVKVMFLDDAGVSLANDDIQHMCIIQCVIHNYSFQNAIFLVKKIISAWPYDKIIGKPKDYRRKKVTDLAQNFQIDWGQNPLPAAIGITGNFTFGIQEVAQENEKQEENPSLTSSVRETVMKQSSVDSSFLNDIVQLEEKTPPRMSQSFSHKINRFTQEDFQNLESILQSAAKARQAGYTEKIRVTNSAGSLKELLDVVDLFELTEEPEKEQQKEPLNEMDDLMDMLGDLESQKTATITSIRKSHVTQKIQEQSQVIDIDELMESTKKKPNTIQNLCPLSELIVSMRDGWACHVQVLAKGEVIHQANKRTAKFHCLVRDSQQSAVLLSIYDVSLYGSIEEMQFYYISDGLVSQCQQCPDNMPQISIEMGRQAKIIEATSFDTKCNIYTPLNLAIKKDDQQFVHTIGILRLMDERPYVKAGQTRHISIYSVVDPISNCEVDVVVFGRLDTTISKCDIVSLFNMKVKMGRERRELQSVNSFVRKNIYSKEIHQQFLAYATEEILNSIVPWFSFQQRTMSQLIHLSKMKLLQPNLDISSQVVCRLISIRKDKIYYLACRNCNKKVQEGNGKYHCQKCRTFVNAQARYIVSGVFGSDGGVISVLFEARLVKRILGSQASEVDEQVACRQLAAIEGRLYQVQLTACLGDFNGQTVVKYTLRNMKNVNVEEYQQDVLSRINRYLQYL